MSVKKKVVLPCALIALLLVAAVLFVVYEPVSQTLEERTVYKLETISDMLERYRQENGRYPDNKEGIAALFTRGYASNKYISDDGWGSPFVYNLVNGVPHAYSIGENKKDERGMGDDLVLVQ